MKFFPLLSLLSLGLAVVLPLPAQELTTLHVFPALPVNAPFPNSGGGTPSGLVLSSNSLYGTTLYGGSADVGIVFSLTTNGQDFAVIHTFTAESSAGGAFPSGNMIIASGDTLIGTAEGGGTGANGTIFALDLDGENFTDVFNFGPDGLDGVNMNGAFPDSGVILFSNVLYGNTISGGTNSGGTVFSLDTTDTTYGALHQFSVQSSVPPYGNPEGAGPIGGLVLSGNTLYGAAEGGGTNGFGTIFSINTNGEGFTVLHTFSLETGKGFTNADGGGPAAIVISGNTLYGVTHEGGMHDDGAVFSLNTDGTGFKTLHSFDGKDGDFATTLILAGDTLYGATLEGGSNSGTLFAINVNGSTFRVLHTFGRHAFDDATFLNTNKDGFTPQNLVYANNTLYGVTTGGGSTGAGTIFSLPAPPFTALTVSVAFLPDGTNKEAYAQNLTATGGQEPYTWKISSGKLPKGLALSSAGVLSGTPTAAGTFDFTVEVKDTLSATATQSLSLNIFIPDETSPTLAVTSPKKNASLNSDAVTVAGTAKDNVDISNVFVSVNGGDWTNASTLNNWANWSVVIGLIPGNNTISAYAADTSGNVSKTNSIKVLYKVSTMLVVETNGDGTVSPNDNGVSLIIGDTYSITAKPAKGFGFVNWTDGESNVLTTTAKLTFEMASNFVFIANFADVTKPVVTVTSPKKNAKLTVPATNVSGMATDNVAISNVWYQINGGGWFTVSTANNFQSWDVANVPVLNGPNVFEAYAVDTAGNVSATNTVKFTSIYP